MMDVDDAIVDAVEDEMSMNVNVLHMRMRVRVVCASNGSKIVTVE
jgi:hypothetical protein